MWKQLISISTLSLYMLLAVSPAFGQGGAGDAELPVTTQVQVGKETMKIKLTGDDLSQYTVVSMCLLFMNKYLQETHSTHKSFLSKIGVNHDSPGEEFLVGVTRKAVEIILTPDFDRSLKGEAFRRHQFEEMKKKARNLGIVYRSLLDGLEEAGLDSKRVVQFCETEIRPNTSHSSSGGPSESERYMTAVKEFDKQMAGHHTDLKEEERR